MPGTPSSSPVQVNYYTQPREINDVRIVRSVAHKQVGAATATLGEVRVTQQVIGYRRVQQFREEVLGVEDLDLPAQTFDTVALWWEVPPDIAGPAWPGGGLDLAGGLHAVEHAAIGLLPLFAMCDRWDIGGLSTPHHPDTGTGAGLHLRRLSGRRGHRREGVRPAGGAVAGDLRGGPRLPLRGWLSQLHPEPQVRQQQRTAGQAGGGPDPGRSAEGYLTPVLLLGFDLLVTLPSHSRRIHALASISA